jgi:hypothetical protein
LSGFFYAYRKTNQMTTENSDITLARLDERFKGFQAVVTQMADDMRRMTESYEKLVESNQRVGLVEKDIMELKSSQLKLWEKYDALSAAFYAERQRRADEAAKKSSNWLGEIFKVVLTAAATITLFKMGIHP